MKIAIMISFLLSIWHSILFYQQKPGISVILFFVPLTLGLLHILRKNNKIKKKQGYWLIIPIIMLSITYAIWNQSFFQSVNIVSIILLIVLMIIWLTMDVSQLGVLVSKIASFLLGPIEYVMDALISVKECFFSFSPGHNKKQYVVIKRVVKGILFSIPVVLVVLGLLISADSIFATLFSGISEGIEKLMKSESLVLLIARVILILLIAIYFISFSYYVIKIAKEPGDIPEKQPKARKDVIAINCVLTIFNIIYAVFCTIQVSVLFTPIARTQDFNYAQYARTGFFQLMAVSVINFAIILFCKTGLQKNRYTMIMQLLLAAFTIIIVFSSGYRMYLYENEFGYTFLRLMVYAILATELIAMVPTIIFILKEKINIIKCYLVIGITMYVIINYINIDQVIAKRNIDRYFKTGKIDVSYLQNETGVDAVSQMVRLLEVPNGKKVESAEEVRIQVNNYLVSMKKQMTDLSWQEWNMGKQRADEIITQKNLKLIMLEDSYETPYGMD